MRSALARVDPATGRILALRRLGASFSQALAVAGSLWVATASPKGERLLRLRPDSLALIRQWPVGGGGLQGWNARVLAVAGGGLWVAAGDRLLRLSLPDGHVSVTVRLAGAVSSHVSANTAGTRLVVGEADNAGLGAIQRRDPLTGTLLASHRVIGVTAPVVAGPIGSGVWLSEPTGMMGYVQRFTVDRLASQRDTIIRGTNGITVWLADSLLWVTQAGGGKAVNFCGDPSDGHPIAPLVLPQPAADMVLAIGNHRIFYAAPGPRGMQYLREVAFPSGCRAP